MRQGSVYGCLVMEEISGSSSGYKGIWCLCVNHIRRLDSLMLKLLKISRYFELLLKIWSKVFNEGLFFYSFNKWRASSKWADQVIYCCEMAFVTASFIHFTLTKDWFKIWSSLNYSWILYYPLGSLWSRMPTLAGTFFIFLNFAYDDILVVNTHP